MSFTWNTPDDVINDLARVTGVKGEFDRYLIRGEKPPPPRADLAEEDEEVLLRYGNIKARVTESYVPDFRGITEMLRMVEEEKPKPKENLDSLNIQPAKVIVSKLNPNVSEFVPKSSTSSQVSISDNKRAISPKSPTQLDKDKMEASKVSHNVKVSNIDDEKAKIEAALKEKITKNAQANTLKEKKERNVAIAALLKLNSRGNSVEKLSNSLSTADTRNNPETQVETSSNYQPSGSSKIVLFTPEYFQQPKNDSDNLKKPPLSPPSEKENLSLAYDAEMGISSRSLILARDPEVQESTNKVNGWFERNENEETESESDVGESEQVAPAPQKMATPEIKKEVKSVLKTREELGPPLRAIIFKPKNTPVVSSSSSSPTTVVKPTGPKSYVPSQRAQELAKMYKEKKEKSELLAKQKMDLWDRVQLELKERDEIIKKKREEKESSPTSSSSSECKKRIFP